MKASLRRVWLWPLVLAVSTATGLVGALFSDGWGDAWAWFALSVPLAAVAWCCARGAAPALNALPPAAPPGSPPPRPRGRR